jgi:hypothetical protein
LGGRCERQADNGSSAWWTQMQTVQQVWRTRRSGAEFIRFAMDGKASDHVCPSPLVGNRDRMEERLGQYRSTWTSSFINQEPVELGQFASSLRIKPAHKLTIV